VDGKEYSDMDECHPVFISNNNFSYYSPPLYRITECLTSYLVKNMNAREIEKKAWAEFRKWANQWKKDHPEDEDIDLYTLSLMYPDGKLPYNQSIQSDG